jgi:drug/metabolite transporter (DMT)-like permease
MYLLFKSFEKYQVDGVAAIGVNYITASLLSLFMLNRVGFSELATIPPDFYILCIGTGISFFSVFMLLNLVTLSHGVSASTIVSRMSLVIPTSYAIIVLNEKLGWIKAAGIILALVAIYFTISKKTSATTQKTKTGSYILIPILAFIGTGTVDLLIKVGQMHSGAKLQELYFFVAYLSAALTAVVLIFIKRS